MEQEVLVKSTIRNIKKLPVAHIQEVNDFVEFIIQKSEDKMITEGLERLSTAGKTFDFLYDESELYTVNDLKVRYA